MPSAADCYRFVLTNPHIDVCLTAPKNDRELSEALSVFDRGPMADDELGWMKRAGAAVRESARRMPGPSSKSLLQHAREMARSIAENGITEDLISRFNR